jgi:hypothetical protein
VGIDFNFLSCFNFFHLDFLGIKRIQQSPLKWQKN